MNRAEAAPTLQDGDVLIKPEKLVIVTAGDFSKAESTQTSNQGDRAKDGDEKKSEDEKSEKK